MAVDPPVYSFASIHPLFSSSFFIHLLVFLPLWQVDKRGHTPLAVARRQGRHAAAALLERAGRGPGAWVWRLWPTSS